MDQERIQRIMRMEDICDRGFAAVEGLIAAAQEFQALEQELRELEGYYMSRLWQEDRESDRIREIPQTLKRGILAEDTIYDLLTDISRMREILTRL